MAETFNSWILQARYKTIVSMLEEIRVKVMQRIGQLRQFGEGWRTVISPMALKNLEENIDKSMKCSLTWNGDAGYEVKEEDYIHEVDFRNMTCSCRYWQLRGIPCPHAICAMHHKQLNPIDYVLMWYHNDTYLSTYSHFIQPCTNMAMWPESNNPYVEPPVVKRMPGRPRKLRRKEAGESKKTGKLSKVGGVMTCSNCNQKGHNKRGCPSAPNPAQRSAPTPAQRSGPKAPKAPAKSVPTPATRSAARSVPTPATPVVPNAAAAPSVPNAAATPSVLRSAPNAAPTQSSQAEGSRGRGTGRGQCKGRGMTQESSSEASRAFKKPRMVGFGMLVTDSGNTILNPGLPSKRVIDIGPKKVIRSAEVTGDIGFQPRSGLKWNGKAAISSSRLQQMRGEKQMKIRSAAKSTTQSQGSSNGNAQVPWKL